MAIFLDSQLSGSASLTGSFGMVKIKNAYESKIHNPNNSYVTHWETALDGVIHGRTFYLLGKSSGRALQLMYGDEPMIYASTGSFGIMAGDANPGEGASPSQGGGLGFHNAGSSVGYLAIRSHRPGGNNGSYGIQFQNYTNAKSTGSLRIEPTAPRDTMVLKSGGTYLGRQGGTEGNLTFQASGGPTIKMTMSLGGLYITGVSGAARMTPLRFAGKASTIQFDSDTGGSDILFVQSTGLNDDIVRGGIVVRNQTSTNSFGPVAFFSCDGTGPIIAANDFGAAHYLSTQAKIQFRFGGVQDNSAAPDAYVPATIDCSGSYSGSLTSTGSFGYIKTPGSIEFGDIAGDNYSSLRHLKADDFGFDFQHNNAASIVNEQGTTNQVLVLGDVDNNRSEVLFGIANNWAADGNGWTKKFVIQGDGNALFYGTKISGSAVSTGSFGRGVVADTLRVNSTDSSATEMVIKSSDTDHAVFLIEASDGIQGLRIDESSGGDVNLTMRDTSGNADIFLHTATNTYFNNNGNFGIGTTSPAQKLDIQGSSSNGTIVQIRDTGDDYPVGVTYNHAVSGHHYAWYAGTMDGSGGERKFTIGTKVVNGFHNDLTTSAYSILTLNQINGSTNTSGDLNVSDNLDVGGTYTNNTQPAFLAYNSVVDSNRSVDTDHKVEFNIEVYDQANNFDNSTDTFTAPTTGKYLLSVQVRLDDIDKDANWINTKIVTSNREYRRFIDPVGFDTNVDHFGMHITVVADMDANDTAHVIVRQSGGSAILDIEPGNSSTQIDTFFSGYLLG